MRDDDLVAWFRAELESDIEAARLRLGVVLRDPLDPPGELEISPMRLHALKVEDANAKLEKLRGLRRRCFPTKEEVVGEAELYLSQKERKLT